MIQLARRPPRFNTILFTSVAGKDAPVLCAEIAVLLAKDAIEPFPLAEKKKGFYSPHFIVLLKGDGLRTILDLRVLNRALHRLLFKMLTQRQILPTGLVHGDRPEGCIFPCTQIKIF